MNMTSINDGDLSEFENLHYNHSIAFSQFMFTKRIDDKYHIGSL